MLIDGQCCEYCRCSSVEDFKKCPRALPGVRAEKAEAEQRTDDDRPSEGEMKHHPTVYRTSPSDCWATCTCGWKSSTFVSVAGVHRAFVDHLSRPGEPS